MKENIIFEETPKNTRIDRDDELVKMVTAEPTPGCISSLSRFLD